MRWQRRLILLLATPSKTSLWTAGHPSRMEGAFTIHEQIKWPLSPAALHIVQLPVLLQGLPQWRGLLYLLEAASSGWLLYVAQLLCNGSLQVVLADASHPPDDLLVVEDAEGRRDLNRHLNHQLLHSSNAPSARHSSNVPSARHSSNVPSARHTSRTNTDHRSPKQLRDVQLGDIVMIVNTFAKCVGARRALSQRAAAHIQHTAYSSFASVFEKKG